MPLAKVDLPRRHQDAHRARRDHHERAFTTRSIAASHPISALRSARTTIPAVSIVIDGSADRFAASGFCGAIMTGTNTAPRPPPAPTGGSAQPCARQRVFVVAGGMT